jgi:hypothetical protein
MAEVSGLITVDKFVRKLLHKKRVGNEEYLRYLTIIADGLQKLNFQYIGSSKTSLLEVNTDAKIVSYPGDYVNYVSLSVEDSAGKMWTFTRDDGIILNIVKGESSPSEGLPEATEENSFLVWGLTSWIQKTVAQVKTILGFGDTVVVGHLYEDQPFVYAGKKVEIISPYVTKQNVYKGQLHCHTTGSDGVDTPTALLTAYKNAGYSFVVITDHDYLTAHTEVEGILHIPGVEESEPTGHIVSINPTSQKTQTDSQEVIDAIINDGGIPIMAHPNLPSAGWSDVELESIKGYFGVEVYNGYTSENETRFCYTNPYYAYVKDTEYAVSINLTDLGTDSGLPVFTIREGGTLISTLEVAWGLNEFIYKAPSSFNGRIWIHAFAENGGANFSVEVEVIETIDNVIEGWLNTECSNAFSPFTTAGSDITSAVRNNDIAETSCVYAENKWDTILSKYIKSYATAVDDCHNVSIATFNKGWVHVFADNLTLESIVESLKRGNFYASTGPSLSVLLSKRTITATTDSLSTITWIGSGGSTLRSTSNATTDSYTIIGNEVYVRIKITRNSDSKNAWSNPIYVYLAPTSELSKGGLIRGNTYMTGNTYFTGKVGIGTITPAKKLDVNGGEIRVKSTATGFGNGGLQLIQSADTTCWQIQPSHNSLYFGLNDIAKVQMSTAAVDLLADSVILDLSSETGVKQIKTGGTTNLALSPGGDVGIGTTTCTEKLEVNGSVNLPLGATYKINGMSIVPAGVTKTINFNDGTNSHTVVINNGLITSWDVS